MTENQRIWARARDRLTSAVVSLGFPEEFAGLLAQQLKSPKAMDRMASYLYQAKPGSVEMIVDEMLAICEEIDAWREKKEAQEAQAGYSRWLTSAQRWRNLEEAQEEEEF